MCTHPWTCDTPLEIPLIISGGPLHTHTPVTPLCRHSVHGLQSCITVIMASAHRARATTAEDDYWQPRRYEGIVEPGQRSQPCVTLEAKFALC